MDRLFWVSLIDLGDKNNHIAGLHLPQILYFAAFSTFFGLFRFNSIGSVITFVRLVKRNYVWSVIMVGLMTWTIKNFTIAHLFILADNRHFTFYIWRYFLKVESLRLSYAPIYFYCSYALISTLAEAQSIAWILLYSVSVLMVLVPAPLIEFRYYIIPYLIASINSKKRTRYIWMEIIMYIIVNAGTIYVFLQHPFQWNQDPGSKQRFMW